MSVTGRASAGRAASSGSTARRIATDVGGRPMPRSVSASASSPTSGSASAIDGCTVCFAERAAGSTSSASTGSIGRRASPCAGGRVVACVVSLGRRRQGSAPWKSRKSRNSYEQKSPAHCDACLLCRTQLGGGRRPVWTHKRYAAPPPSALRAEGRHQELEYNKVCFASIL